jgi:hypothetical protein
MLAISAKPPVTMNAAPIPCSTRAANSVGPSHAIPHAKDARAKMPLPTSIARRRPYRSANAPANKKQAVKAKL